jgi:hypothetical protein
VIHRCAAALGVALLFTAGACGNSDRHDARNSLVQQLVDGGLERPLAECVVDAFFKGKSDEQLKGFFDRPELTPDERAEFEALGGQCTAPTTTVGG